MDDKNLPYFFSETLATRAQLTARQRVRAFTLEDLDWLDSVYFATHTARMASQPPMQRKCATLRGAVNGVDQVAECRVHRGNRDNGWIRVLGKVVV